MDDQCRDGVYTHMLKKILRDVCIQEHNDGLTKDKTARQCAERPKKNGHEWLR